ncbi:MAG TPA: FHA domain-containing protein, partial [Streptosporangiaceae bacterium]|nr:FHA domain-containing protein [Streptosporangiaceae bacterium]
MAGYDASVARLVVTEPPEQAGVVLEFSQPQMIVGRSSVADLVLDDQYVSSRQAFVTVDPSGRVTISDLKSTGGTFVNDERLTGPHVLREGDLVRFADLVARFEPASAPDGPVAADTATLPLPQQPTQVLPVTEPANPVDPPVHPGPAGTESVDATTYTVTGTVIGTPAAGGLSLRLVDKNVGGDVPLAQGTTNLNGSFLLSATIPVEILAARHKSAPDLQVQVLLDGAVAASSAVAY